MIRTLLLLAGLTAALPAAATEHEDRLCLLLHRTLSFCEAADGLHPVTTRAPEALAVFSRDDDVYAKVLAEEMVPGTKVTDTQVRAAIRTTVTRQIAELGGSVELLGAAGMPTGTLRYAFGNGASRVEAVHSYILRGRMILQFITFAPRGEDAETAQKAHAVFLSQFRLVEPDLAL